MVGEQPWRRECEAGSSGCLFWPCLFPRPGDALAGDARHGEASQKSLSAFHRPQYKFRVLLPLRLTEARKTPGVWRDFFVGSLLSVENPIISGPKQALRAEPRRRRVKSVRRPHVVERARALWFEIKLQEQITVQAQ